MSEKSKWVLRSKVFSLAKEKASGQNYIEIITWLDRATKLLEKSKGEVYSSETKVSSYFSPGEDCLRKINQLLSEAKNSLDICVFTITDDRIVDEILAAKKRGVKVRVISDNHKSEDLGSDIEKLSRRGVEVKIDQTANHMHHKFMLVDHVKLLTGSYNWTRSAATSNEENILITNDAHAIKEFQGEFDKLWQMFTFY